MKKAQQRKILKAKQEGITLIALVITIIILLILAGVTIAALTGDNGILRNAGKAKKETEQAKEDELRKLTQAEATTYTEEHEYRDVNGETVTIPAKCAVSQVEGENTLEEGLVIIDINGNEWVWIEVPRNIVFTTAINQFDYANLKNDLIKYAHVYREGAKGQGRYWDDKYHESCGISNASEYEQLYNNMLSSIYINEGFWIGRYETGYSKELSRTENNSITEIPKIQKNLYPYNWVTCSQAQALSSIISPDNNKNTSLMFGIQWDLVCRFLEEKSNLSESQINSNSTSWGNYSNASFELSMGQYAIYDQITNTLKEWNTINDTYLKKDSGNDNIILISTGASEYSKRMNIYDFAGNMWEWTLEFNISSDNYPVRRGCGYRNLGSTHPASNRGSGTPTESGDSIGFRIAMF